MDITLLQSLWDWLLPAGWLATAIAWWRDRKVYQVRAVKETEGTYKTLYDDLSATVLEISKQLRKQNERNINHETALQKLHTCKYADRCPVIIFLRQQQKGHSETVRSDSLRTSVTEQTTYEPVPKRTATLSVSARQMKDLVNLSQGIGISARNNGLSIDIQSDGEGGVNVTATADSLDRKVTTRSEMSDHRIRDETGESKNITQPGWKGVLWKLIISAVVILGISTVIKRKLKR